VSFKTSVSAMPAQEVVRRGAITGDEEVRGGAVLSFSREGGRCGGTWSIVVLAKGRR
jgi:hypothetical protein